MVQTYRPVPLPSWMGRPERSTLESLWFAGITSILSGYSSEVAMNSDGSLLLSTDVRDKVVITGTAFEAGARVKIHTAGIEEAAVAADLPPRNPWGEEHFATSVVFDPPIYTGLSPHRMTTRVDFADNADNYEDDSEIVLSAFLDLDLGDGRSIYCLHPSAAQDIDTVTLTRFKLTHDGEATLWGGDSYNGDNAVEILAGIINWCYQYINSPMAATEREPMTRQVRRARERAGESTKPDWYVVTVDKSAVREFYEVNQDSTRRWRLTRQHGVRGHWRRLRSGRVTWVRPYVKGPAGTRLIPVQYEVK